VALVLLFHVLSLAVVLIVFGIVLPWWKGIDFLDPVMIGAYCCLGGLFAVPASIRIFENERPPNPRSALVQTVKAAAFGEVLALSLVALGIVTVNLSRPGRLRLPELDSLAAMAVFGLIMALAFATSAGWLALRFSGKVARTGARAVFLLLAVAFYYDSRRLPEVALTGVGVSAVLAAFMGFQLYREAFRRLDPHNSGTAAHSDRMSEGGAE
jgi:hypothetical protein